MSERKLTEEARALAGHLRTLGEHHKARLVDETADALEAVLARERPLRRFVRHVASLDPTLGPMDIQWLVADACALCAVPVETQEAAEPDDYTRLGWRMFPVL